jgi:hypothetical protein
MWIHCGSKYTKSELMFSTFDWYFCLPLACLTLPHCLPGVSKQSRNVLFWKGGNVDQHLPFPSVPIV